MSHFLLPALALASLKSDEYDKLVTFEGDPNYGDEYDDLVDFDDDDANYGDDYDGDDDYDGYGDDDYDGYGDDDYGARMSKAERLEYRRRRKQMRRGYRQERQELRDFRHDARHDNDGPQRGPGGGGPVTMKKHLFSNSVAVTAAAFSMSITPYTQAVLEDFILTGPSGTIIATIMVGDRAILPAGAATIESFASTSFFRDLAAGFVVNPGVPIVITGTGGGSGTVSGLFRGHGTVKS